MLELKEIHPVWHEWVLPLAFLPKKDIHFQKCVEYRNPNEAIVCDSNCTTWMEACIELLWMHLHFLHRTKSWAFGHVEIAKEDKKNYGYLSHYQLLRFICKLFWDGNCPNYISACSWGHPVDNLMELCNIISERYCSVLSRGSAPIWNKFTTCLLDLWTQTSLLSYRSASSFQIKTAPGSCITSWQPAVSQHIMDLTWNYKLQRYIIYLQSVLGFYPIFKCLFPCFAWITALLDMKLGNIGQSSQRSSLKASFSLNGTYHKSYIHPSVVHPTVKRYVRLEKSACDCPAGRAFLQQRPSGT